jgi:predicted TPR repeat methyltransferase
MNKKVPQSGGRPDKVSGASDFVTEAYNAKDPDSLRNFYAKWAEDYDNQMLQQLNYYSPRAIALAMQEFLEDREAKIIDIGCGTGLTAGEMHVAGYTNLYGIDISPEMVDIANDRGIYHGLKVGDINQPLEYDDRFFDGAISSGTFPHGHVGPEPLGEIFRILKPGGILACTIHMDLWQSRKFDDTFQQFEESGLIKCLSRKGDRFYEDDTEPQGWFCVYLKQ